MKKIFALVLALLLVCGVALAEETEYTTLNFEDGFSIDVPGDWIEDELTTDMTDVGIFFSAASPDGARRMAISWSAIETDDINVVAEELSASYTGVEVVSINDIAFASFEAENSSFGLAALDAEGSGMYVFTFYPSTDAEFVAMAQTIAASITNTVESEAE